MEGGEVKPPVPSQPTGPTVEAPPPPPVTGTAATAVEQPSPPIEAPPAAPAVKPSEPSKPLEPVAVVEAPIRNAARAVLQEVGINVDKMTPADIEKIESNLALTSLLIELTALEKIPATPYSVQFKGFLLAGIYEALNDSELASAVSPNTLMHIKKSLADLNIEVEKLRTDFIKYAVKSPMQAVYGKDWEAAAKEVDDRHVFRNATIAIRVFLQNPKIDRDSLVATINKLPLPLTEGDRSFIKAVVLMEQQKSGVVSSMFAHMGIDVRAFSNPVVYIRTNMEKILPLTAPDGQPLTAEQKEKRGQALIRYSNIKPDQIIKKSNLGAKIFWGIGGVGLILMLVQRGLGFGVDTSEQPGSNE